MGSAASIAAEASPSASPSADTKAASRTIGILFFVVSLALLAVAVRAPAALASPFVRVACLVWGVICIIFGLLAFGVF